MRRVPVLALALLVGVISCGDGPTAPPEVASVQITGPSAVQGGSLIPLEIAVLGPSGSPVSAPVTLSTPTTGQVQIDGTRVLALGPGTARIRAEAGGSTAEHQVEVSAGPAPSVPGNRTLRPDDPLLSGVTWGDFQEGAPLMVEVLDESPSVALVPVVVQEDGRYVAEGPGEVRFRVRGPGTEWAEDTVEVTPSGPLVYRVENRGDTVRLLGHALGGLTSARIGDLTLHRVEAGPVSAVFVHGTAGDACEGLGDTGDLQVEGAGLRRPLQAAVPRPHAVSAEVGEVVRLTAGTRCLQLPAGPWDSEYALALWDRRDYRVSMETGLEAGEGEGERPLDHRLHVENWTSGPAAAVILDLAAPVIGTRTPSDWEIHGLFQRSHPLEVGDTIYGLGWGGELRGFLDMEVVADAGPNLVVYSPLEDLEDPGSWPEAWDSPRAMIRRVVGRVEQEVYPVLDHALGMNGRPKSSPWTGQMVMEVGDRSKWGSDLPGAAAGVPAHPYWEDEHGAGLSSQAMVSSHAFISEMRALQLFAHELAHTFQFTERWYGLRAEDPSTSRNVTGSWMLSEGGADFMAFEALTLASGFDPLANVPRWSGDPGAGESYLHGSWWPGSFAGTLANGYRAWANVLRYLMEQRMVALGEDHMTAFVTIVRANEAGFSGAFQAGLFHYPAGSRLEDVMRDVEPEWTMEDWILHYLLSRGADDVVDDPRLQDHRIRDFSWTGGLRTILVGSPDTHAPMNIQGGAYVIRIQDEGLGGSYKVVADAPDEDLVVALVRIR